MPPLSLARRVSACESSDFTRQTIALWQTYSVGDTDTERLVVSPTVVIALGQIEENALTDVFDARELKTLECFVCHAAVPPESDTVLTVSLFIDPSLNQPLIQFAHAHHHDSEVVECDLREYMHGWRSGLRTATVLPFLRKSTKPRAVLLSEQDTYMKYGEYHNARVAWLVRYGFEFVVDDVETLRAPTLGRKWRIGVCDDLVVLNGPGVFDQYIEITQNEEWMEALLGEGQCLIVTGALLGLGRYRLTRVKSALQAGAACAGVVRAGRVGERKVRRWARSHANQ